MHGAPSERDRDHRGLEQEEAPVLRLPEVAELGQTFEREVRAGEDHHGDERNGEPCEPDERRPSQ